MWNPIVKTEFLREGRGIRLSLMVIFYNAILAMITIMIMLINAQSFSEGYYYDPSTSRFQFVIISSLQIATAVLVATVLSWVLYTTEPSGGRTGQFSTIPGFFRQFVLARLTLILSVNILLFISSLPILLMSAVYSGVGWLEIARLFALILMLSFWSTALSIFCFSISRMNFFSICLNVFLQIIFYFGTYMVAAMVNGQLEGIAGGSPDVSGRQGVLSFVKLVITMILMAFNPVSSYMGYRINITGDSGLFSSWCAGIGVDINNTVFSYVFYKLSAGILILSGVLMIHCSVRYLSKKDGKIKNYLV